MNLPVAYLSREDLVKINRRTLESHGGNFVPPENILKKGALEYVVEIVQSSVFGEEAYPGVIQKAAVYLFQITNGHVFADGNKRTGLGACLLFLSLNLHGLNLERNSRELYSFVQDLASGLHTLDSVTAWLVQHVVPFSQ